MRRSGDVLVAQGDLPGALKSYRDGLAISRSPVARRTPATRAGSATSRCRINKVGDVLVAQGDLAGALKSYRDSLAIAEQLSRLGSRQRRLAARPLGVVTTRSATCWWRRATWPGR